MEKTLSFATTVEPRKNWAGQEVPESGTYWAAQFVFRRQAAVLRPQGEPGLAGSAVAREPPKGREFTCTSREGRG